MTAFRLLNSESRLELLLRRTLLSGADQVSVGTLLALHDRPALRRLGQRLIRSSFVLTENLPQDVKAVQSRLVAYPAEFQPAADLLLGCEALEAGGASISHSTLKRLVVLGQNPGLRFDDRMRALRRVADYCLHYRDEHLAVTCADALVALEEDRGPADAAALALRLYAAADATKNLLAYGKHWQDDRQYHLARFAYKLAKDRSALLSMADEQLKELNFVDAYHSLVEARSLTEG